MPQQLIPNSGWYPNPMNNPESKPVEMHAIIIDFYALLISLRVYIYQQNETWQIDNFNFC